MEARRQSTDRRLLSAVQGTGRGSRAISFPQGTMLQPARITDWENLGFGITPTNGHVRYTWSSKTSSWDAGRFITDPYVNLHVHAGVLHYGMTLFEGCKAFRCKDGKVRVCNLEANAERLRNGANRLVMAPVPTKVFIEAIHWAVRANAEYVTCPLACLAHRPRATLLKNVAPLPLAAAMRYQPTLTTPARRRYVPPYGSGGSLYIRPFLIGSSPVLGLQPCSEFQFMVSVIPVGNYFGKGPIKGIDAKVRTRLPLPQSCTTAPLHPPRRCVLSVGRCRAEPHYL
eukprot:scaffold127061_cov32-Tisochrysis_lutea.AAC.3